MMIRRYSEGSRIYYNKQMINVMTCMRIMCIVSSFADKNWRSYLLFLVMNVDRLLYILRTITIMHVDIRFNAYISIDSILLYVYVIMSLLSINNNYNYLRSSKKNALSELAFFYPCFMFNKYKMTTVLIACSSNATYNYCLLVFLVSE